MPANVVMAAYLTLTILDEEEREAGFGSAGSHQSQQILLCGRLRHPFLGEDGSPLQGIHSFGSIP